MSSLVSKAGPESEWGSDSRIAAVRRWHEKSVASRHDQSVLLLDGADLRPGLRVLDLACGAGTPALAEARRVGPRGNVVGTDTSEAMLSLAREYAQEEGLANAEFRVADAGALPFEDGSFDRVTSGFGAMYFPDLSRALAETFRVLRPGGRLAWLVWGPFDQPFYRATAQIAMRHAGISELPPEAAQPFCFSGGGILQRAVAAAGFEQVRETSHEVFSSWPGPPEEMCEVFYGGAPPFRGILDRLDADSRRQAMAEATEMLRKFCSEGRVRVPEIVILVTGVRPSNPPQRKSTRSAK